MLYAFLANRRYSRFLTKPPEGVTNRIIIAFSAAIIGANRCRGLGHSLRNIWWMKLLIDASMLEAMGNGWGVNCAIIVGGGKGT